MTEAVRLHSRCPGCADGSEVDRGHGSVR